MSGYVVAAAWTNIRGAHGPIEWRGASIEAKVWRRAPGSRKPGPASGGRRPGLGATPGRGGPSRCDAALKSFYAAALRQHRRAPLPAKMTTLTPRPPYSQQEIEQLYPKHLQLQLVQVVCTSHRQLRQLLLIAIGTTASPPWSVFEITKEELLRLTMYRRT